MVGVVQQNRQLGVAALNLARHILCYGSTRPLPRPFREPFTVGGFSDLTGDHHAQIKFDAPRQALSSHQKRPEMGKAHARSPQVHVSRTALSSCSLSTPVSEAARAASSAPLASAAAVVCRSLSTDSPASSTASFSNANSRLSASASSVWT